MARGYKQAILLGLAAGAAALLLVLLLECRRSAAHTPVEPSDDGELHLTGYMPYDRIADTEAYRLRVYGKVDAEVSLALDDVKAMPSVETDAPLECVLGWTDHAVWRGVPVRDVLSRGGPHADGTFVVFRDDRDFCASLSMDYVETGRPLLAWEVNGEPLPREHGWPLRVVAPGKFGYKWVKWVTAIEVTDRGYEGTYEGRGFSLDGDADGPRTERERQPQ
ncbi:MAG: hypothetical protein AMK73_10150 [Planctomycetes bacterium SM23_32]|nr:MAG: hypothetical protein AMK73_10150 [Planctomycetes bacterium SM23_32]